MKRRSDVTGGEPGFAGIPVQWSPTAVLTLAPGCSPWRLRSAHASTRAHVTDGDGGTRIGRARSADLAENPVAVAAVYASPVKSVLRVPDTRQVSSTLLHRTRSGRRRPVHCS